MPAPSPVPSPASGTELGDCLRQMVAALEAERQALAGLEADGLIEATRSKEALCAQLSGVGPDALDPQMRELAESARALNEVNRRVRNLLAANIAARLEALGAPPRSYAPLNSALA
ncbi:flagellar protein FlgN [Erythrobacter sp.]|uniref:flagellar protein FlgN n=1 Tax=Erythrobacter sp. TaxID=1042 RepID=UPI002ED6556E